MRPRGAAWNLAEDVYKHKESQDTFYSLAETWKMLAPSSTNPEERQFVIESGAFMHMLSKKDLNSEELDSLKRSRPSITVVTGNGEVQTNEEAQVYVHDLRIFVTVQLPEDTSAVLFLGKLCKEHGYTFEWASGRATSDQKREAKLLQNRELRSFGSSWTVIEYQHKLFLDIASAGSIYFVGPQQVREARRKWRETATRSKLLDMAGRVFPNGWRTSHRTSRS